MAAAANHAGGARPRASTISRRKDRRASSTDSMTVTHTGNPAFRKRSTSMRRFSSLLVTTRSGRRPMTASQSGFFVPRRRVTSRPTGWVHQSVAPTRSPGADTARASVREGTNETTRAGDRAISSRWPRSSSSVRIGIRAQRSQGHR